MANPKRRHSRSRRDKRRANWKLDTPSFLNCTNCGNLVMPHRACSACGHYNGKIAIMIKVKKEKQSQSVVQEI